MAKRNLSLRQKNRIQSIQERRRERAILKNTISDDQLESMNQLGPEVRGTVITNFGAQIDIEGLEGNYRDNIYRCHIRANLEPLVTGDTVIWRHGEPNGVIVAREPRSSELLRPDPYGKLRPVAANVDRIAIVFAAKPTAYSNLIDRYLIASEAQNIQPVLVVNKIDMLKGGENSYIEQLISDYRTVGYEVLKVSVKTGAGIDALKDYLAAHTSILVGQSGVGKSSLINQLQPDANILVGALSEGTDKGTHTTTASRLFHLENGGHLIDSPGIREFAVTNLSDEQIIDGFIEFRPFLGQCKFRDCKHISEQGCALLEAAREGKILDVRLQNYRNILASQDEK
ncbi:MAG: small ribosomal subunit biogenesis GTPase RsgA [Porticoccaceae bacterium]